MMVKMMLMLMMVLILGERWFIRFHDLVICLSFFFPKSD